MTDGPSRPASVWGSPTSTSTITARQSTTSAPSTCASSGARQVDGQHIERDGLLLAGHQVLHLRHTGRQVALADRGTPVIRDRHVLDLSRPSRPRQVRRALKGVGPDVASTLLLAACDNPERLTNERSFASLCGVSPVQASSGKTQRHRLNRGGDRQANAAMWRIALVRLNCDQRTKDYPAKRGSDGKSKTEAIRYLKRYWGVPRILDRASFLRGCARARAAPTVQPAVQG